MKKAIALISQHECLKELDKKAVEVGTRLQERAKFLNAQAEKLEEERDRHAKDFQAAVEAFVIREGMLPPEYDKTKHHFHVDGGAVVLCDHEETGLPVFLRGIFL